MKRQDILSHVGHISQVAEIREIAFREGRAGGMNGWQIKNGPLNFTVMKDKALDLCELSYKGMNMSFLSKPGLHGRIRTTPAEHTGQEVYWKDDEYHLSVHGEMREAELLGENLVLKRRISTVYPGKQIIIEDEIENQGFRDETAMLLYHFNVGYPLLEEGAKIILPTEKVVPRDKTASLHTEKYCIMETPKDQEPEYVFLHQLAADEEGNTFGAVINEKKGLGIRLDFNKTNLPYFMEWKSLASGDYVVGLEPANSSVYGRAYHEEEGDLHRIRPFAREKNRLVITVLEGEELARTEKEAEKLAGKGEIRHEKK